jgi:hypothetical protein
MYTQESTVLSMTSTMVALLQSTRRLRLDKTEMRWAPIANCLKDLRDVSSVVGGTTGLDRNLIEMMTSLDNDVGFRTGTTVSEKYESPGGWGSQVSHLQAKKFEHPQVSCTPTAASSFGCRRESR